MSDKVISSPAKKIVGKQNPQTTLKRPAQGDIAVSQGALFDPAALTPEKILALQRTAGNQAVQRLLAQRQTQATATPSVAEKKERLNLPATGGLEHPRREGSGISRMALAGLKAPIQREVYDVEWETSSKNYSRTRRQEIKAELREQFAELAVTLAQIEASLRSIVLPGNSELGQALTQLKNYSVQAYITWENRAASQARIAAELAAARRLAPQIADLVSKAPVGDIVRMQTLQTSGRRRDDILAANVRAAAWAAANARNATKPPTAVGGSVDISGVLAHRNSSNVYHKKPYDNLQNYFAAGSYSELRDTAHEGGIRVILDNANPAVYWYGYNMTHGGATIYYWDGARWHGWNNAGRASQPYPQEALQPDPGARSAADEGWLAANQGGLTASLDRAANPAREERRRAQEEERRATEERRRVERAEEARKLADETREEEALAKQREEAALSKTETRHEDASEPSPRGDSSVSTRNLAVAGVLLVLAFILYHVMKQK